MSRTLTTARHTSAEPAPRRRSGARPDAHASAPTLQRQMGNRAYRQATSTGGPRIQRCACGGTCPHCKAKEEAAAIQTKLTVGPPGDAYEREAEAVAERVTRMPDGAAQGVGGAGAASGIQRLAGGEASAGTTDLALPTAGARSLSPQTRAFMEPRFGADFSGVRIHEGREAESAVQKLEARAFTSGRDIWLGRGAAEGDRRLMAHELTHVVQQSGGGAAGRIQRDPPRPAPAAPQECPGGRKTVTVDLVSLRGSSRNPVTDLDFANRVFRPCCVQFTLGRGLTVDAAHSDSWLAGDTEMHRGSGSAPHAEEAAAYDGASVEYGLGSRFRAFYVDTLNPSSRAYSRPPIWATGAAAPYVGMVGVTNGATERSLAHEFGHILLNVNDTTHTTHPGGTDNLMEPTNSATGATLEPAQCATIFANA